MINRILDRFSDLAVVAFAVWTAVYHVGLLVTPRTWVLLTCWLVVLAILGGLYAWRLTPEPSERATERAAGASVDRPPLGYWAFAAIATGVVAGAAAGLHKSGVPWWLVWVAGLLSVAATAVVFVSGRVGPQILRDGNDADQPARGLTAVPVLTAVGFAIGSLFLINTDGDDAFFVSRSVWTAAHGRIALQDVIFTQGEIPPIAGEPPVSSIEVLVGALARELGVPAASLLWYVVLPVVVFLAVWALWRLVREWAPRRLLACFAVAVVYLVWSGESAGSLGAFHLLRMWQGKAMFVSALIPLLYVYLTRWAERRSPAALGLAAAAGVAATGLSSTAALLVPLVVAAVAAPLIITGRVRAGLAATAALAYPVGAGLLVTLTHSGSAMVEGHADGAAGSYSKVLLAGVLGVIGGCALWLGPWLARPGVPALITGGVAAVTTVLLVNGLLEFMGSATGAGPVMWRTMWVVPAPVLVGLLATVALPRALAHAKASRWFALAPAGLVSIALVVGGLPLWTPDAGTLVEDRPSWKAVPKELRTSRMVVNAAKERGGGVVLMPQRYMRTVPMFAIKVNAVSPNSHHLHILGASRSFTNDRRLLHELVQSPRGPKPDAGAVRDALHRVEVTVACAYHTDQAALRLIAAAGYGGQRKVGGLGCLFAGGSQQDPDPPAKP
ncbi:DUF6077 domain-containing protein [Actinomadura rudentiformis]|uniref:Uncharacterized protein n=1 Tax=Actinomadura rudentiformis TaxID=359158 RepID=A0A6H9YWB6_9ACTN|nr:DUF6077 domain-containing protein [Actinomadura rudentiformis]KAB2351557.1 hypothetical protein F8566_04830 [Actinomadura rudentiformis]